MQGGRAGVHLHRLHRDEGEKGVEVQHPHDGRLSRAVGADAGRAVLRLPRDGLRRELVRFPCRPYPVRPLLCRGHHAGTPGAGRHRQVLQQQGRRGPLQLRERVVPAVGEPCRQRVFGKHPHDILLEAEDAQGVDKHHQPVPRHYRPRYARLGKVLRSHRPVHPPALGQGLRHDGVRLQVPGACKDALLPVLQEPEGREAAAELRLLDGELHRRRILQRINPIQRKYIPDLAAASETAATLLASLNKGGGDKKGGSEAFFTNSAENFLAAIIYFFVNFHPVGFKDGKKLRRFILHEGKKLEIVIRNWDDFNAVDGKGNVVLDFVDEKGNDVSTDEDRMFVELEGFRYKDRTGKLITIDRCWYEDEKGNEVEPDTVTGEYSDMPHVLSFLGRPYEQVFNILMQDDRIASLMAPFKSAYENKANDQLEGMVGTLRVNAARLVSPEAYWVFTGDDFDLKISDREHPSYLVIANDPEKEQVIGSLNALVLNRLVTRVNSKGNIPVSIIVDELPTLYFHKIDRLIGTARSNKVAVTLGFQELPQLEADYGKVGMQKIITTCGNIFMGAARNKETLEWAQNDVFGKAKQTSRSISINDQKVSTTISEKMDYLVPAAKIADMATGWLAGQAARDFTATDERMLDRFDIERSEEFKTTKYFCKTHFDMKKIKREEEHYVPLPKIYEFKNDREKEIMLNRNFKRVNQEVEEMIKELLGIS